MFYWHLPENFLNSKSFVLRIKIGKILISSKFRCTAAILAVSYWLRSSIICADNRITPFQPVIFLEILQRFYAKGQTPLLQSLTVNISISKEIQIF